MNVMGEILSRYRKATGVEIGDDPNLPVVSILKVEEIHKKQGVKQNPMETCLELAEKGAMQIYVITYNGFGNHREFIYVVATIPVGNKRPIICLNITQDDRYVITVEDTSQNKKKWVLK